MKRLEPLSPERAAHFSGLKDLNRALASRGVSVHMHRTDPEGDRWELFVGRKGRNLKVRWDGAAGTLTLEPTRDGAPTSHQVAPEALFDEAIARITAFYGLTST